METKVFKTKQDAQNYIALHWHKDISQIDTTMMIQPGTDISEIGEIQISGQIAATKIIDTQLQTLAIIGWVFTEGESKMDMQEEIEKMKRELGDRLYEKRIRLGLSAEDVAKYAELTSRNYIDRIEKAVGNYTINSYLSILIALDKYEAGLLKPIPKRNESRGRGIGRTKRFRQE